MLHTYQSVIFNIPIPISGCVANSVWSTMHNSICFQLNWQLEDPIFEKTYIDIRKLVKR